MRLDPRLVKAAAALMVTALIAVPVVASAVPGRGGPGMPRPNASRDASATVRLESRHAMLHERIANVLANRSRAFGRAASRIALRIEDVAALATKAGEAGGDISGVTASLDEARAALAAAKSAEASAVEMFKAVPDSTDRRAAFDAAKAKARSARAGLAEARSQLRAAILKLEAIVSGLQGAAQ